MNLEPTEEKEMNHLNAVHGSIIEEFPNQGVILIVSGNALGASHMRTNLHPLLAAAQLDHMALHLRGTCTVCPK